MRPDDGIACQVLTWLANREDRLSRRYAGQLQARHQQLAEWYPRLTGEAVRRSLPPVCPDTSRDLYSRDGMIFLEVPDRSRQMIPIVSVRWDFVHDELELRLRVGMFLPSSDPAKPHFAIGIRYEPPEGRREGSRPTAEATQGFAQPVGTATPPAIEGRHDYYHAQFIRAFVKGQTDRPLPNCPDWIPTSTPALMLSARSSLGLLTNLVVALYGRKGDAVRELRSNFDLAEREMVQLHVEATSRTLIN